MKTPTSNKAGGTMPAKKVVKKVPAKAGASPVQSKPVAALEPVSVPKKEEVPKIAASPVKAVETKAQGPELSLELKGDLVNTSKAQVDPRLTKLDGNNADERSAAVVSNKPNELNATVAKPKTKTVIVKKKVVVSKKSATAAGPPATEPIKTSNEVKVAEKQANVEKEAIKQLAAGRELAAGNLPAKETKPASLAPEKSQKGVRKVIVKGKGATKEVIKGPQQEKEVVLEMSSEVPSDAGKGQKVEEGELLLRDSFKEEVESVEADEVEEGGTTDIADEELQLYDNQDAEFEEEPEYEDDVEEEEGAEGGEEYHADMVETGPLTERQKRKKLEVFVGGLDKDATEDDLRAAFMSVGDVVEVRLMMNPVTGKNKGYAFVRFGTVEQAGRAASEFAVTQIRGKECGVLPNQDNDTLFIGNISRDWRASEVLQKLKEYGINGIEDLTLITDPQNEALNRGYAFLELATHYDAVNAFQRLQRPGIMFGYDRPAKVSWAQPLNEPDISVMSQVKSVFVDGVPPNWPDDKVKQSFGKFGEIERIVFARNMPSSKRKDFAFVNFASRESALACVEAFREVELPDGDRKVKVKVSLTRPLQKGRFDRWSTQRDYPGQGRGQPGRGEGWISGPRFGSRRGGRGFGRSGSWGMTGHGGKRLYDEDEVRMLLRALREDEGWPSTTRGRESRFARGSRGTTRGAYSRNEESRHYNARGTDTRTAVYRQQNDTSYSRGTYNRPASELGTSRGRVLRPGAMRDDYEPQRLHQGAPSPRSRVAHSGRYPSPRHEGGHHQRYEEGHMYDRDGGGFAGEVHDYSESGVGMKRPISVWDEDSSYFESTHRGYPRARVDYSDPGSLPDNVSHYPNRVRSPSGPAMQALGIRQGRSGLSVRDGPNSSFYDSGSGLGKAGGSSAYDDHSYNTVLPETSGYVPGAPERRETSMYPSSLYGGHSGSGGYDLQAPGYY